MTSKAFTLIELLVVLAIISVLMMVVISTINPIELLKQSRDTNRLSDMTSLDSALKLASLDSLSFGSSSVIYVSIPDPQATSTAGTQCQGLSLPSLPSPYTYHCAASSTYRNTNGQGWIPVNFTQLSQGSPLGQLPIDPINQASSKNYYTYTANTQNQFEITTPMEAAKFKLGGSSDVIGTDGGPQTSVYEKGSNLYLEPMDYGDPSLVGYWTFDEGTGTTAYDYSGNNASGSWKGTAIGTNGYYSSGQIGPYAGAFEGVGTATSTQLKIQSSTAITLYTGGVITYGGWIKLNDKFAWSALMAYGGSFSAVQNYSLSVFNGTLYQDMYGNAVRKSNQYPIPAGVVTSSWNHIMAVYDGQYQRIYFNGVDVRDNNIGFVTTTPTNALLWLGSSPSTPGYNLNGGLDDIRIYNRVLSNQEIKVLYSGGK